jgi:alpha-D-xyloside xylohydrolase
MRAAPLLATVQVIITLVLLAACAQESKHTNHFAKSPTAVVISLGEGAARKVRLEILAPKIIHVTAFPSESTDLQPSLMAVAHADGTVPFNVVETSGTVLVKTDDVLAEVSLATGRILFRDSRGRVVLSELAGGRHFTPVKVQGENFYSIRQQFESPGDEAFYGLGQHQNGQMNYKGGNVELAQHNMDVAIPFLASSRNYGLLWDNNSITRFGDPREWQPLQQTLKLYDADGKEGGLTAHYYDDSGKLRLTRVDTELDYQYGPKSPDKYPAELAKLPRQKVAWDGKVEARTWMR